MALVTFGPVLIGIYGLGPFPGQGRVSLRNTCFICLCQCCSSLFVSFFVCFMKLYSPRRVLVVLVVPFTKLCSLKKKKKKKRSSVHSKRWTCEVKYFVQNDSFIHSVKNVPVFPCISSKTEVAYFVKYHPGMTYMVDWALRKKERKKLIICLCLVTVNSRAEVICSASFVAI